MRFLSVCSGIEAASVAWEPLGWRAAMLSEIEAFPRAVLAHRWGARSATSTDTYDARWLCPLSLHECGPDDGQNAVPLWGDFTALRVRHLRRLGVELPDLIVGGTPCQAFSVAGLRRSLADARGNLSLEYLRLAHAFRRAGSLRWLVWENVPGVLNTADNAFGCFLGGLVGADDALDCPTGPSWPNAGMVAGPWARAAWRVLDAQHFGLAQRRRRVFVVAGFGGGADPAQVLFERRRVPGHSAPGQEARQDVAGTLGSRATAGGGLGTDFDLSGGIQVSHCLNAGGMGRLDAESETFVTHALKGEGFDASEDGTGRGVPLVPMAFDCKASGRNGFGEGDISPTLRAMGHKNSHQNAGGQVAVAVSLRGRDGGGAAELGGEIANCMGASAGGADKPYALTGTDGAAAFQSSQSGVRLNETHATLDANNGARRHNGVMAESAVRRLTPRECERLQGFPDDYTAIPWRGREASECPDGPRYRALGNSMAVPVMGWIGERISAVDAATAIGEAA